MLHLRDLAVPELPLSDSLSKLARFSPPIYGDIVFLAGGADLGANRLSMFPPSLLVFPYKGWPNWSPTAHNIPPSQPSARQDALFPERGPSNSFYLSLGEWPRLPSTARDILTRPTPSAPRRALLPREHSFIVRVLRARRAPGRSHLIRLQRAGCEAGWAGQRHLPQTLSPHQSPYTSKSN